MITKPQLKHLRKEANQLKALYQIGKNDITDNSVMLLNNALKAKELIKVSALTTVEAEIETLALDVARLTNSDLIETKGRTFVLYKRNPSSPKIIFPK